MLKRFRFLPLALLVLALPLCSDFFKTTARRAPAEQPAPAATTTDGAAQPQPAATPAPSEPLVMRIGVVNYNGSERTHFEYEQILSRMAQLYTARKISFRLVDGAYDDVLEWYKTGMLDVAILSPGVVAELLSTQQGWQEMGDLYVASESAGQAYNYPSAVEVEPGKPKPAEATPSPQTDLRFSYNSVCLVRADSTIRSADDIRRLTQPAAQQAAGAEAQRHKIKFIFVHALSVSGYILPEYVLREKYGIDMTKENREWTYDHSQSLRELAADDHEGGERVAFVKDDAAISGGGETRDQYMKRFRRIRLDGLAEEGGSIPQDVVLIHRSFLKHRDEVRRLFEGYGAEFRRGAQPKPGEEYLRRIYEAREDWQGQYGRVVGWLSGASVPAAQSAQQFLTLEEIVAKIRNLKRSNPNTRLALVLSGGGAKCAYQLGAIRAIEDELDTYADEDGNRDVDIDLVVGTSGGAINALCVALGLTRDPRGMSALERTWEGFSETTFFEPWGPFPATVGLFIGLSQAILLILAVRLFADEKINWHRHVGKVAVTMIAVAALLASTRARAWAVVPLIVLFAIVCARLFGNPTREWWKHAGWAMAGLAALEVPAAFFGWTPWHRTQYVVAVTLAALTFVVIVVAVRINSTLNQRWWRNSLVAFAVVAAVEILLLRWTGYWDALTRLDKNHVVHHLWLLATLGLPWTVLCLAFVGAGLLLIGHGKFRGWQPMEYNILPSGRNARSLLVFRRHLLLRLSLLLPAIVALQLSLSLFHYDSLSASSGIQRAMAEQVPALVRTLPRHKDFAVAGATDEQKLDDLSRRIVRGDGEDKDWLTRDLVITSMKLPADINSGGAGAGGEGCAPVGKADAATDWYFYFDHKDARQLADEADYDPHAGGARRGGAPDEIIRRDPRFRSLRCAEYDGKLMDVVIGSSSIFPVFQPRTLTAGGVAAAGGGHATLAELIDGGFAHNSPIEAAVLWGATHIILVEASPEERQVAPSGYLLANSVSAFNYLFNQAQLTDARSRGRVEIFSLRPQLMHRRENPARADGATLLAVAENPCAASYVFGENGSAPVGADMCTFDFVRDFVRGAINLGSSDASKPCFRRERAQPIF
jgi:predicted acylesterase/phospholipase RssA/ABC-type phosphate/phosphonate transport system substrate-binding protein